MTLKTCRSGLHSYDDGERTCPECKRATLLRRKQNQTVMTCDRERKAARSSDPTTKTCKAGLHTYVGLSCPECRRAARVALRQTIKTCKAGLHSYTGWYCQECRLTNSRAKEKVNPGWSAAKQRARRQANPEKYRARSPLRYRAEKHNPVVYFIGTGDFVKIGTSHRLHVRLSMIQGAHPTATYSVLATVPGAFTVERELHQRFAASRHRREWFRLTPDIQAFIDTLNAKAA